MSANHQHLRAFHAIATDGSITRAARRLNVAQPTLSQQLKALEDRHRTALFDGRKPPLRLTPTGQRLYALTQRLFATSDEIGELLGDLHDSPLRSVRIGSDSPIYAARLVAALRALEPDLAIQARIGNARETIRWLSDALIDAAIVADPPGDNQYAYEPLYADELVLATPLGHPLAQSPTFQMSDLAQERLLMRERSSRTRAAIEQLLTACEVVPRDIIELHTRETIREGIALGLGVSMFISSECPPDARIAYRPMPDAVKSPGMSGYVICLAERSRSRLMRTVMAAAADLRRFSPLPIPDPARRAREIV